MQVPDTTEEEELVLPSKLGRRQRRQLNATEQAIFAGEQELGDFFEVDLSGCCPVCRHPIAIPFLEVRLDSEGTVFLFEFSI